MNRHEPTPQTNYLFAMPMTEIDRQEVVSEVEGVTLGGLAIKFDENDNPMQAFNAQPPEQLIEDYEEWMQWNADSTMKAVETWMNMTSRTPGFSTPALNKPRSNRGVVDHLRF